MRRIVAVVGVWLVGATALAQEVEPPEVQEQSQPVPSEALAPAVDPVTPTAEPQTAAPPPQAPLDEADAFYKGDLGTPGAPELENPNNAFFIGVGYFNVGGLLGEHYARLRPSLDLYFDVLQNKKLTVRLEGPVNVLLYDRTNTRKNHGLGTVRKADYDEASDYLKVVKQLQLGRKEDKLYVNVGLNYGASLGHGTVMRRYNPNLDLDRSRLGLQLDAYNDYGGFETFVADLAFQTRVMGGLAFIKPMSFVTDNAVARTWSVGAHYTTDLAAPRRLLRETSASLAPGRVRTDAAGYPLYESARVGVIGVDSEIKPLRLGNLLDFKIYVDHSKIEGAGGGTTAGFLLRSNVGARPALNAFRVRLEGRLYDDNYVPQYFDSLYEVQKFQLIRGEPTGLEPTKYEAVVENTDSGGGASAYAEVSYALVDKVVVGVALERVLANTDRYNMLVHVEVPAFEFLRLYASYQKFGFQKLSEAFKRAPGDGFRFESNAVLLSQARLMILPILFVSGGIRQTYRFDPTFRSEGGDVLGAYRSNLDYLAEVELGWEFN